MGLDFYEENSFKFLPRMQNEISVHKSNQESVIFRLPTRGSQQLSHALLY